MKEAEDQGQAQHQTKPVTEARTLSPSILRPRRCSAFRRRVRHRARFPGLLSVELPQTLSGLCIDCNHGAAGVVAVEHEAAGSAQSPDAVTLPPIFGAFPHELARLQIERSQKLSAAFDRRRSSSSRRRTICRTRTSPSSFGTPNRLPRPSRKTIRSPG